MTDTVFAVGTSGPALIAVALVTSALGYLAARSIVAEANAHRLGRQDNWWNPDCEVCDDSLDVAMRRCRYAGHSQRAANYWIVGATVATFVLVAIGVDNLWVLPAYLWFAYFSILLTVTDLDTKLIPNRILLPATVGGLAVLGLGALADGDLDAFVRGLLAGLAYFIVMLILGLIARGALGFGDVKLAFFLGLFVGYIGWEHLVLAGLGSFILGGIVALILVITKRASRKDAIPFGPFMTIAAVAAVVAGNAFLDWYLG